MDGDATVSLLGAHEKGGKEARTDSRFGRQYGGTASIMTATEGRHETIPETDGMSTMEHSLRDRGANRIESLDFDLHESFVHMERERSRGQGDFKIRALARWGVNAVVGVLTAAVALAITLSATKLVSWKLEAFESVYDKDNPTLGFVTLLGMSVGLALAAGWLVSYIEPVAGGSGISEIKCILNGAMLPRVLDLKTLVVKAVGVSLAVASGLPVGKEGPMIHSGSVIGSGLAWGRDSVCGINTPCLRNPDFRVDQERRDFISCGAAAGVAAAFNAPVGGLLFSLEEGSSFWTSQLTWRAMFTAMITAYVLNVSLSVLHEAQSSFHTDSVTQEGMFSFGNFVTAMKSNQLYHFAEIPIFILIGAAGGILGAIFNLLNKLITRFRLGHVSGSHAWCCCRRPQPADETPLSHLFCCPGWCREPKLTPGFVHIQVPDADVDIDGGDGERRGGRREGEELSARSSRFDQTIGGPPSPFPSGYTVSSAATERTRRPSERGGVPVNGIGGQSGGMCGGCACVCRQGADASIPAKRLTEVVLVSVLVTSVSFLMASLGHCHDIDSDNKEIAEKLVHLHCPSDQFNDFATFFLNSPENSIHVLFHYKGSMMTELRLIACYIVYALLTCVTYGISVPSGLFIPSLLAGSALGRAVGDFLRSTHSTATPVGTYALIGAAAVLGGMARMTVSLAVILIECTGDIGYGLPLILTLTAARYAGNLFNEGLYDIHIHLRRWPLLEEKPHKAVAAHVKAEDVMVRARHLVTLPEIATVAEVLQALDSTTHHAFPVVFDAERQRHNPRLGAFAGIAYRKDLAALLRLGVFHESRPRLAPPATPEAYAPSPIVEGSTDSDTRSTTSSPSLTSPQTAPPMPLDERSRAQTAIQTIPPIRAPGKRNEDEGEDDDDDDDRESLWEQDRLGVVGHRGGRGGVGIAVPRNRSEPALIDPQQGVLGTGRRMSASHGGSHGAGDGGEGGSSPVAGYQHTGTITYHHVAGVGGKERGGGGRGGGRGGGGGDGKSPQFRKRASSRRSTGPVVGFDFHGEPVVDASTLLGVSVDERGDLETLRHLVHPQDLNKIIDLRPFLNATPFTIHCKAPVARVYRLFRGLGLRHLVVLDDSHNISGLITRTHLTEDSLDEALHRVRAKEFS